MVHVGDGGRESFQPVANSENLSRFLRLSRELFHEAREEGGGAREG